MHKPKERERAASPGPTYMNPAQMCMISFYNSIPDGIANKSVTANFLQDLRANRPTRPVGSRPPPAHFNTWSSRTSSRFSETPAVSPPSHPTFKDAGVDVDTPPQAAPEQPPKSHKRTTSNMSIDEVLAGSNGRALVQPPRGRDISTSSTARDRTPSIQYRESGRRQIEREEARELRLAMEELDVKNEQKVYDDARDEAAELVWKHINPNAPENQPNAPYAYPGLTKSGRHQRSQSLGRDGREQDLQRTNSKLRKRTSMGSSAGGSRSSSLQSHRTPSGSSVTANAGFSTSPTKEVFKEGDKADEPSYFPKVSSNPSDPKERRRSSSGRRKVSASLFKNPNDQIYEEPEEDTQMSVTAPVPLSAPATTPAPAKLPLSVRRNPFSRVQLARDNSLIRSNTDPVLGSKRFDRIEIQRNPPSQSRNAAYTSSASLPVKPKPEEAAKPDAENDPDVKMKDGKEIRGDDIRAATGFRLKDRSAKLPTPTMVSDSPGRPIVSFKNDWKPKEVELKQEVSLPNSAARPAGQTAPPRPLFKSATEPAVPTINVPEETRKSAPAPPPAPVPQIKATPEMSTPVARVSRAQIPTISVYEDPPVRPLPNTNSRKVNAPPQNATPPIPTINVSQTPPTRPKPHPAVSAPIPTISIQETPSISVSSAPAGRGPSMNKAPSVSATTIPTISFNEPSTPIPKINAPSISVTPSIPSINVDGPSASSRPLPHPKSHAHKPFPRANTMPVASNNRSHWTPTKVRTGALCQSCALPISGRIVSAAGSRFHPECFLCHHCGEHLECVAFYPEPDNKRVERVDRIRARMRGEDIQALPSHPTYEDMLRLETEDGHDESPRFFCHLDFHELFSPRCKSCKTPIEGEVVVACGAEWHVGHFFCAQCGDPFDSSTPFVEKDGYAWCVNCHTNRYSAKCKKCRRPVTDMVVKALGSEWHAGCFCCVVSTAIGF